MNSGVYKWHNVITDKNYIGKSVDLLDRKRDFLNFNNRYTTTTSHIDNARKKYNSTDYWEYEVLEYCTPDELNEKEIYYIDLYDSNDRKKGYNLTKGGEGVLGIKFSDETIEKMRANMKELWQNEEYRTHQIETHKISMKDKELRKHLSEFHKQRYIDNPDYKETCREAAKKQWENEEFRKFQSEFHKQLLANSKNHPMYGKHHTEEARKKISEANKNRPKEIRERQAAKLRGRKLPEEQKQKISNSLKGRVCSEETRKKIGESKCKSVIQIDINTNEVIALYKSIMEASNNTNIHFSDISKCCKGERKTAGKYKWVYADNNKDLTINS